MVLTGVILYSLCTIGVLASTDDTSQELCGIWIVGGFYYNDKIIDLSDNDNLANIYLGVTLVFDEDSFLYCNYHFSCGEWFKQNDNTYILKTESVFTYEKTDEGFEEKEVENSSKTSYIVSIIDQNTLTFGVLDPMTGKAKVGDSLLIFEQTEAGSQFIADNKTMLNSADSGKKSTQQNNSKVSGSVNHSAYISSGMKNALQSAKDYLKVMSFSYSGLIEQLEYEGYSYSEAKYAADNCGADWYEQAAKSAENYLQIMPFSRSSLIEQLEYEGYTHQQTVYGVDKTY